MSEEQDASSVLNENLDGWNTAMGVRFVRATASEVIVEWTVGPQHLQAYGIVHGGVYCGVIETIASVGAALFASRHGLAVVGLENQTSFLKAVREGVLRATAKPVSLGRRTQVWQAEVHDERGRTIAAGRVRTMSIGAEEAAGGTDRKIPHLG